VWAPGDLGLARILVMSVGKADELEAGDWLKLGGQIMGRLKAATPDGVTVILEMPGAGEEPVGARLAADAALGLKLRSYHFDKYKTRKDGGEEGEPENEVANVTFGVAAPAAAQRAFASRDKVGAGVMLARDLVNEPANSLGPIEFARKAQALSKLGVAVDVLTEKEMKRLKMAALLGVAQGSARPPRLVVMRWNGAREKGAAPVAFVGKGVVFDTGGISIKPATHMEDMKGDMAGAATVVGLMQALAARKARVNAVGVIGLVENMPDGKAQRPGDIVTSMSGQTIEIINTDAEGRLVLADALWYTHKKFAPKFIIDLATLTGAVLVALGNHHSGLFSNNDELAERLAAAGEATGEKVWRLPLGKDYDKQIDSKNADMKNAAGRHAGAITAAQFLQRFVDDVPWAHLDVAGTAMGSPADEVSQGWASGYGVRLLDRLVADHYEE
ncbi:MAG TPA: leucyl aminopeptidase, partial [Hyphomicrobiales bacterium]|nr:leucyl aminopeptidase [Hyphomicrobiales bacterium]